MHTAVKTRYRIYKDVLWVIRTIFIAHAILYARGTGLSATVCATPDQIKQFCVSDSVKIVFSNNKKLFYVDFMEKPVQIHEISKSESAVLPVISPCGEKIAYATGVASDGITDFVSKAWLCDFSESAQPELFATPAYVPRFVKNTAPGNLQVVYSTSAKPLATKSYVWEGAGCVVKRNIGAVTADTVCSHGGYFGGLSWNGRFLTTAENSNNAFLLDLDHVSEGPRYLHRMAVKKRTTDADTTIDIVCCNPSISSSREFPNTAMFFDFSSDFIEDNNCYHPVLGTWGVHDRIFIYNDANEWLKIYDVPAEIIIPTDIVDFGKGEKFDKHWNYPEWSNHPYYAIATAEIDRLWKNTNGMIVHQWKNEAIYLVNLKDSTYLRIIETSDTSKTSMTNMCWPGAWINVPESFTEDTLWLKKTTSIKGLSGVPDFKQQRLQIINNTIVSGIPIQSIAFYDCRGRRILQIQDMNSSKIPLPRSISRGAKVVECTFVDNGMARAFVVQAR